MALGAAVLSGIAMISFILWLYTAKREEEAALQRKISEGEPIPPWWAREVDRPLVYRLFKPFLERFTSFLNRFIPIGRYGEGWEERLMAAGLAGSLTVSEFLALKFLGGMAGLFLVFFLLFFGQLSGLLGFSLALLLPLLGYTLPDFVIASVINNRKRSVRRQLPNMIDLLAISVEAGMGFEGALSLVSEKMGSPLPREIRRALNEIRMGRPRAEALRDMARRLQVEEITSFVGAVNMAEELGTPMAQVLKIQSHEIRRRVRARAEEAARKAPIKMLFPLVIFIFPALFIIILGPALIRLMESGFF
ncbi:MAG TPA: type II secretion system F family protein [Moorella mulderi]|nr:type II secretion system F family protein [Moorella mulderi]